VTPLTLGHEFCGEVVQVESLAASETSAITVLVEPTR